MERSDHEMPPPEDRGLHMPTDRCNYRLPLDHVVAGIRLPLVKVRQDCAPFQRRDRDYDVDGTHIVRSGYRCRLPLFVLKDGLTTSKGSIGRN